MNARLRRLTGVGFAAVLVVVGVGLSAAVATADPTDEAVAVASLLGVDDVFAGSTTSGVSLGNANDLPAFAAHGGIREASQTWTATDPIALVFDFRFQFPDEASAVAFLDESEADLAETGNGLQLTPLLDPPLPDTRFYAVDLGSLGVNFNYLMHEGNLAAKVFVGGSGDVTQAQATEIAKTAAARMTAALAGASPSLEPSRPAESGAPGSGTPETTAPETAAPATIAPQTFTPPTGPVESASPFPSPDPNVVAALIATVPEAISESCGPLLFPADQPPRDGEVARVGCIASNGAGISLSAFTDADSLNQAFLAGELVAQTFGELTPTGTCEAGGYDGTWTLEGTAAGNVLCYSLEGAAIVDWTDPAHLLLGSINQALGDSSAAFQAWVEAGNGTRSPGS